MDLDFDEFKKGLWGDDISKTRDWVKWVHRNLSENHCPECLVVDGCWFAGDKHPKHPHHPYCHCVLENLPYEVVKKETKTDCPFQKFNPYLFDPTNYYKHGKQKMFESWDMVLKIQHIYTMKLKNNLLKNIKTAIMN